MGGPQSMKFMPYRSHIGKLDDFLGISMFWSEKLFIIVMYLQRFALLLLWPDMNWPTTFYTRMNPLYGMLLDLTASHDFAPPLGAGTVFEGCEVVCKIVWPGVCLPILFLWSGIALHPRWALYYTRNVERIAWGLVRIGLLPFMNTLMRYFILNQNGDLDNVQWFWITPVSEIGVFLSLVTISIFTIVAYRRSYRQVLFESAIRHEAFIRARELEYKLRFSTVYRNERVWMISSYTLSAWFWSFVRGDLDVLLLVIMTFVPTKPGIIAATCILGINFLYGFLFVDIHRCASSNYMEHVLNLAIFVFSVIGCLRAWNVRNSLLGDRELDWALFGLHGAAIALVILLVLYFFWDSHKFGSPSIADKRAQKKWRIQFGLNSESEANKFGRSGAWVTMPMAKSKSELLDEEAKKKQKSFVSKREKDDEDRFGGEQPEETTSEGFYLPKEATFFSLNCASKHVWPVNGVVINELLRRNQEDHLIDVLRAARKMLDRISALHNTAMLIPTDEMKLHITRLQDCVLFCKRQRVTHHSNAMHPLQTTFEDLIEQFSFELRVFSGRSITVGHNARKMINVSRYLRKRMLTRDHALALVSPLMRRVLIKLLALRMWIQLLEERPSYLLPGSNKTKSDYATFAEDLGADSDDSDDVNAGFGRKFSHVQKQGDIFGGGGDDDLAVNVPLMDDDDEQYDFSYAEQLAKASASAAQARTSPQTVSLGRSHSLSTSGAKKQGVSFGSFSASDGNDASVKLNKSLQPEPSDSSPTKGALKRKTQRRVVGFSEDQEMETMKDSTEKKED